MFFSDDVAMISGWAATRFARAALVSPHQFDERWWFDLV